jgi:hypothetical protein
MSLEVSGNVSTKEEYEYEQIKKGSGFWSNDGQEGCRGPNVYGSGSEKIRSASRRHSTR